jgi:catechol 2,3-dioxygenase-like lactoylglutathione lyase family enzyme
MKKLTKAKMMDHVAISVADMKRSLRFYRDLLGMKQKGSLSCEGPVFAKLHGKKKMRLKIVFLICPDKPGPVLELVQYLEPKGRQAHNKLGDVGGGHICFEMANLDGACSALKSKGAKFISEPVNFNLEDGRKVGCVFLFDPDGYILELVEFKKMVRKG